MSVELFSFQKQKWVETVFFFFRQRCLVHCYTDVFKFICWHLRKTKTYLWFSQYNFRNPFLFFSLTSLSTASGNPGTFGWAHGSDMIAFHTVQIIYNKIQWWKDLMNAKYTKYLLRIIDREDERPPPSTLHHEVHSLRFACIAVQTAQAIQ